MGQKNVTMISAQAYGLTIGHKNMATSMYNLYNLPFTNINTSHKTSHDEASSYPIKHFNFASFHLFFPPSMKEIQ